VYETDPGHDFENRVCDVDFVPEEAIARGGLVAVVVVVPAFSECNKRQKPVIAAFVTGVILLFAPVVHERVDRVGSVAQEECRGEIAIYGPVPASDQKQADAKHHRRDHPVVIDHPNFGILLEIRDAFRIGGFRFLVEEPEPMAVPEPFV